MAKDGQGISFEETAVRKIPSMAVENHSCASGNNLGSPPPCCLKYHFNEVSLGIQRVTSTRGVFRLRGTRLKIGTIEAWCCQVPREGHLEVPARNAN